MHVPRGRPHYPNALLVMADSPSLLKIDDYLTLIDVPVDVRSPPQEQLLCLVAVEPFGGDQPAGDDGSAPCTASLAMHVNFTAAGDLLLHELHGSFDVRQTRMCKVDRRNAELFDSKLFVFTNGTGALVAGIDDRCDSYSCQSRHVASKRKGAQQHVGINFVPPMSDT